MAAGAEVYVSFGGGSMTEFEEVFGLTSHGMVKSGRTHRTRFPFGTLEYAAPVEILASSVGAEVLAVNEEGNVVFARNAYGKGAVYYLGFPLEQLVSAQCEGFLPDRTQPYYQVYRCFAERAIRQAIVRSDNPCLGVTQSRQADGSYLVAVLNYTDRPVPYDGRVQEGWRAEALYGSEAEIPPCDGLIFRCTRERNAEM